MFLKGRFWRIGTMALALCSAGPYLVSAQELPDDTAESVDAAVSTETGSIVEELVNGADLLEREIASQARELSATHTDRERQLVQQHLAFLRKERQTLLRLLNQLVGSKFDIKEYVGEQQREYREERLEKRLERDERFPSP